jgi:RNA polymerase sigma-70 factor (sigma-E family)
MRPTEEAEFEEFVAATARSLRRTAYLLCGDWHRAEDATQDALLKVYAAWRRLDHGTGIRTYAHRAVTTAVIDQGRRSWRREISSDAVPERPVDPIAGVDRRDAVVRALQELPDRRRACVVLRFFADLSVDDTAAILGVSPGTVKSQTARALESVRDSLVTSGVDLQLEDLS